MKSKSCFYIWLLIILSILIISIVSWIYVSNKYNESNKSYEQSWFEPFDNISVSGKCPPEYKKSAFCQWDINEKKCRCKFQKDQIHYPFPIDDSCCNKLCQGLPEEDCILSEDFDKAPYWCNIGGKCVEYQGTIVSGQISANNCGLDPLNNQLLLPYASLDDCKKSIKVCDQYNDPKYTEKGQREICLGDPNCGYCTNDQGNGKCIEGTPEGPLDLQKYYFCNPDENRQGNNLYEYGDRVAYLLQPATNTY